MLPRSPLNQVSDILDIGCGVGRFTERIFKATGAAVSAIDTAPTAIAIAKARYPEINFQVATVPPLTFPDEAFDVVTIRQLLWYVLPKMPELFSEARRVLRPGGCCLVIQSFFRPGEQHYGNAYMTTPEDLVNVMLPLHLESRVDIDPESDWNVVLLARKD